jgi:hypothetical protein
VSELAYGILMIEYDVAVAEQAAQRLAEEAWNKTIGQTAAFNGAIDAYIRLQDNQPNDLLMKFVRKTFDQRIKELNDV